MAVKSHRIKGSTLIETLVAFTIIIVCISAALTLITDLYRVDSRFHSNSIYAIKYYHEMYKNDPRKNSLKWKDYIIHREQKSLNKETTRYFYSIENITGKEILTYGFLENQ
mgnify:CR=1 FL=1